MERSILSSHCQNWSLLANTAWKLEFYVSWKLPELFLTYRLFFHFQSVLDIQGKGDMDGSFENSRARVKMVSKKYVKNGQTFIKFEKFNLKIQIGKNRLNLKNLFNGDPNLGTIGNQFINENSELFLGEIIPGLEKNLAEIFTKTANEIVENASFDEMFPDIPPKGNRG